MIADNRASSVRFRIAVQLAQKYRNILQWYFAMQVIRNSGICQYHNLAESVELI